jgi:hypothetical protein
LINTARAHASVSPVFVLDKQPTARRAKQCLCHAGEAEDGVSGKGGTISPKDCVAHSMSTAHRMGESDPGYGAFAKVKLALDSLPDAKQTTSSY